MGHTVSRTYPQGLKMYLSWAFRSPKVHLVMIAQPVDVQGLMLSNSLELEYVILIEDSMFAFLSRAIELSVVLSSRMEAVALVPSLESAL